MNPRAQASEFVNLKSIVASHIQLDDDAGLEVGPFDRPFFLKSETNVSYLDYRSGPELRDFAAIAPGHSPEWVVEVDYVVPASGDWSGVPDESFDWVLSCHALEHSPNLIGFLQVIASKLKPNGLIISMLPDKRRTFDAFRPLTTIGRIFEDYLLEAKRPSIQSVIDHKYYVRPLSVEMAEQVHLTSAMHIIEGSDIKEDIELGRQGREAYIDSHNYVFTSSSFESVMRQILLSSVLNFEQILHTPTADGDMTFLNIIRKLA